MSQDVSVLSDSVADAVAPSRARPDLKSWTRRVFDGRQWLKKIIRVPLGIHCQYRPRPLTVPPHYTNPASPSSPLTFSIVTPSYNQGPYLEKTLRSVLDQNYPHLEYVVQDGGSSDESKDVLARYGNRLTSWESRPDRGQAHAINLGFRHCGGDVFAYLNSDDLLLPGTLHYVADYFDSHPNVDVVYGHRVVIDSDDAEVGRWVLPPHDNNFLRWADFVPQETLFWRRRIWEKVGATLDESFQFALDWDLLLRFLDAGARFARLPRFLGAFRVHSEQKTSAQLFELGLPEMNRLCERTHGRSVPYRERYRNIAPYLCRHLWYHGMYRLGLVRY